MDERKQLKEQNSLTFMVIPSTISSNMGLLYSIKAPSFLYFDLLGGHALFELVALFFELLHSLYQVNHNFGFYSEFSTKKFILFFSSNCKCSCIFFSDKNFH